MIEEVKDEKIMIQQLPRREISSVAFILKMPNFFILEDYENRTSKLYSPIFEFVNSTWRFRTESYSNFELIGKFKVYMQRICFKKRKQCLLYEIELLDDEEKFYKDFARECPFKDDAVEECLVMLNNTDVLHNKRDVLTLKIHLLYVESTDMEADQVLMRNLTSEVLEEVSDKNIIMNQLPRKAISSASYILKVPNFLTLAEYDNKISHFYSPTFEFINSTWRFSIESDLDEDMLKEFTLRMERINFKKLKQRIFSQTELLDSNDEVYQASADAMTFEGTRDGCYLFSFEDNDSCDERDVLTLMVYLFHVELTEVEADEVLMRTGSILPLSDDLKGMLLNGQDYNLTFNVSGKHFRAHQDILRVRSDVFRSMLTHDMLEKNRGVVDVPDCDPNAFEQLLFYIYTGKVETLDETIMYGLYYAADKYNLANLKEECSEFIKKSLTKTTVCDAINLAIKHSDNSLLNSAVNYFFSNADLIMLTEEWTQFMKENSTVANELCINYIKIIRERKFRQEI